MGCLAVFLLQPSHLLRLSISDHEAALALYFLALQVLVNILLGYITGIFMVVDMASRGSQWNNFQRILLILATLTAAWMQVSFSTLAMVQLATYIVAFVAVLIDLKRTAPQIFPSLRYWDSGSVREILKGGGHFGLIFSCTFLSFEAPVLLLQRILGPAAVVAFYLMRVIFSTPRQMLAMLTQSMGPEITSLFAKCDWKSLRALYGYSEQIIFACIPTVNLGVLVASPWLLAVWHVRSGGVFMLHPYVLCAAISIVISTQEHKAQFQYATNSHEKYARFMFGTYLLMIAVSVPMIHHFQLMGFLFTWFATESAQLAYIIYLNHELFDPATIGVTPLSLRNPIRMLSLSVAGLLIAGAILKRTSGAGHLLQIASALATMIVTAGITYVLFDLKHVLRNFAGRIRNRFAPQNV
jgi:O-antigen/teichoic acid export membrane protein